MPNRMLKESICTSCDIDDLSVNAERLFYRLLVQVDDFGRFEARLPIIRARCFPLKLDKVKDKDVSAWLQELIDNEIIKLYMVDDKPYMYFTNWERHQQKRAKHSKYPAPDGNAISHDIKCDQMISDVPEKRETRNEKRETNTPQKIKYAEYVSMYEEQYQKLVSEHGDASTKRMIDILDIYKGAKGKKYKDDYRAILSWVVDKFYEEKNKSSPSPRPKPSIDPAQRAKIADLNKQLAEKLAMGEG